MLNICDALLVQIGLCTGNGRCRGILPGVIQKTDLRCVRVGRKDQIHNGCGIQIIGGSGHVAARGFQRLHKPRADGVGDGGKDDRRPAVLRGRLHAHGDRGGDADEKICAVALEVRDDLLHDRRIRIAVIIIDLELCAGLFTDLGKPRLDVLNDLVERSVVHIVADADTEGLLCGIRRGYLLCGLGFGRGTFSWLLSGGAGRHGQQNGCGQDGCCKFSQVQVFHDVFLHVGVSPFDFLGGGWRGRCRRPNLEYKKNSPLSPSWDKSCTPAIPPKLTLARPLAAAYHHTHPGG